MNEEAIKSLRALLRHATVYADVGKAIQAAIDDLEAEDAANEARLLTLCQSDGAVLTVSPPLYRCAWCCGTWYCHTEPPVCPARNGRDYRQSDSVWVYTS